MCKGGRNELTAEVTGKNSGTWVICCITLSTLVFVRKGLHFFYSSASALWPFCLLCVSDRCMCVCLCVLEVHNYCIKKKKKKDFHYSKDYRVSSMVAPWQLNRVWAGLHCLASTRLTQSEWMPSYTRTVRTHTCKFVWDVACEQAYVLNHSSTPMTGCARTHTHSHTRTHTHAPGLTANMQRPIPGERVHTSHSVFRSQGGPHRCPAPATRCI